MRIIPIAILIFLIFSTPVFSAIDATHVGFVDSSVWFDREPFFSGKNVRVYTTLANSSPDDFKGVVEFYDEETVFGKTEVTLERNGGFQVVWADWVPKEGNHKVSVKIIEATLTPQGGTPKVVKYDSKSATINRFVDTDTDGDGIGNKEDNDDDNDGIPDNKDAQPLVKEVNKINNKSEGSIKKNLEEKSTQFVEKVGDIASSTSPKIIAGVKKTISVIERFRKTQSKNVNEKIKQVKQKIAEDKKDLKKISVSGNKNNDREKRKKKNRPFNQLQLLALTTAGYTLSYKIVFYITGAFILYFLIKKIVPWIYRLIRKRGDNF